MLSAEEKLALREGGKRAREAASQQLAARVDDSDAALSCMSTQGRGQWFQVRSRGSLCKPSVHGVRLLPAALAQQQLQWQTITQLGWLTCRLACFTALAPCLYHPLQA